MMKAGVYYVGDLCYVLGSRWADVCKHIASGDSSMVGDGEFTLDDGIQFASFGTEYGDGLYFDKLGRSYSVDSGTIGCVQVGACDSNGDLGKGLGNIILFPEEFTCSVDNGTIQIGDVLIETGSVSQDPENEDSEW